MTEIATAVLLVWPFVAMALVWLVGPVRGVAAGFVLGLLFLPEARLAIEGFPDYGKASATCLGLFFSCLVVDRWLLVRWRPDRFDLLPLAAVLAAPATSLSAGLGPYDAASTALLRLIQVGIPFFLARVYLGDAEGRRILIRALAAGGLVYVPLCLWEIRMSPHLHSALYGIRTFAFHQSERFAGYRPTVFMQHGLMLAMFMSLASLASWMVWRERLRRSVLGVPAGLATGVLLIVAVLCQSAGALALLVIGLIVYQMVRKATASGTYLLYGLLLLPLVYIASRITGSWSGEGLVDAIAVLFPERAASLAFRFENENALVDNGLERFWLGWGSRSEWWLSEGGHAVPDGYWVILFARGGILNLGVIFALHLVPVLALLRRVRGQSCEVDRRLALGTALLLLLVVIDYLPNAMVVPLHAAMAGVVAGRWVAPGAARRPTAPGATPG